MHKIKAQLFKSIGRFADISKFPKPEASSMLLLPDKTITNGKINARPKNSNTPIMSEKIAMKKSFSLNPFP